MEINISPNDPFTVMRDLLMKEWDPIGVKNVPEAADEYDGYVGDLLQLVSRSSSPQILFSYLWKIETEHMGLPGNEAATRRFADILSKCNMPQ
jgi:hypothetical protein